MRLGIGCLAGGRAIRWRSVILAPAWSETYLSASSSGASMVPALTVSWRTARPLAEQKKRSMLLTEFARLQKYAGESEQTSITLDSARAQTGACTL